MADAASNLNVNPARRFEVFRRAGVAVPCHPLSLRFGCFELDPKSGELTSGEMTVVLQQQPLQLLLLLIDHSGEMVTRDEIQKRLWSEDVIVDFDCSINQLVRRLRRLLSDSAEAPIYIETLARRGYRWKVPVEVRERAKAGASSSGVHVSRFTLARLPSTWKDPDLGEPAMPDQTSSLRLEESASSAERCHSRRQARPCRQHAFTAWEDNPDRLAPLVRMFGAHALHDCLNSATLAERLDALRQLLCFAAQVLEGSPS
jgi:DNA-binding winged helix-turn-helix (wHTH) protein